MEQVLISHPNHFVPTQDELDTSTHIPTRTIPGAYYPEQVYTYSSDEEDWFRPWQDLPTSKHSTPQGSDAYNLLSYVAQASVQRRPSSSYSGLSTPGLSWRDSSCSPLSCVEEQSPVSSAEAISFPAASGSQIQSMSLSGNAAIPDDSSALYAAQDEAQTQHYPAYGLAPELSMGLAAPHDLCAWQAGLPSLGTASQQAELHYNSVASAAQPMTSIHTSSSILPPIAAPMSLHMPELQHPKPIRAYVPPWQTATEFNVDDFVASSSHTNNQSPVSEHRHVAPISASSQGASLTGRSQRVDAYAPEHTDVAMDWEVQDQSTSAPSQQGYLPEGYVWSHLPPPSTAAMVAPPQWVAQPPPQILPSNALLYQPIHSSVTSNLWTDADPRLYTYPRFS